jgi:hypothetical protein
MLPSRRDLEKRREGESPVGQAGMGENGVGRRSPLGAEIENVDVDLARAVEKRRRPADLSLDGSGHAQELRRRPVPADRGDEVQEVRLPRESDRFGPIKGGNAQDRSTAGDRRESTL